MTDAASPAADERRAHERYHTDEAVVISFAGIKANGTMSDLSVGGAMLDGDFAVAVEIGTQIVLSFGDISRLPAVVVYVGEGFCGVQFVITAKYKEAIRSWIHQRHLTRTQV